MRIERINELLRNYLAELVNQEIFLKNGLITITRINCAKDLKSAKVSISVLPDNIAGTALKELRKFSPKFSYALRKKTNLKNVPKFSWMIDQIEKNANELDDVLGYYE